ncbi:unnamed protein product [Notodromas monacha]|uniref:Copper type II ascorbate-dependent monooxygenase C-terminal domain-containing protein n=1 Tax=Notodromas monacha TaxID=399045 RepID=A0A7R9BZY9_9CRUS|nr:unnamed protein product [Notodromas monacha]CAG0924888.1 unnamed protein product [Notodromas monacha]
MYPENVGFPMKRQSDGPAFFMLEMHYNNPTFQTFRDSSGIRVYHTDIIRQQEMGVLELGITVTPFQIIPPNQKSFKTSAICTASCTQNGFPAEGVSVFAGLLHSHLLGRKMKLRLIRNGVEEPWFQFDDHYDFDFQETRVYPEEKKILPGDIFILECTLDSTARTGVTTGGWGTDDEMCLAFLSYYPRSDLMRCFTFFDFDLMQAQMGFPDLFADGNSLTWMVDQNTTWKEYLNNKYAPWSQETVDMFQQIAALQISQSFGFCLNEGSNVIQDAESISGYPDMQEYELPPRDCPTKKSPERVPIEMTKSLKLAFPRMAATNGHFFKRLPKV